MPGEASLAHHGVLFLDELSEFPRSSLEALRQPLEDGHATIVRGQRALLFPTGFMLVAATNPCPCGFAGSERACSCSDAELARHRRRLSGPLLDRLDLLMAVARPTGGSSCAHRRMRRRRSCASGCWRPASVSSGGCAAAPRPATDSSTRAWCARTCTTEEAAQRALGRAYDAGLAERSRARPGAASGVHDRRPRRSRPRQRRGRDAVAGAAAASRRRLGGGRMSVRGNDDRCVLRTACGARG